MSMNLYNITVLLEEYGVQSSEFFKKAGVEMPLLAEVCPEETGMLQMLAEIGTPAAIIRTLVNGKNGSIILAVPSLIKGLDQRKSLARGVIAHELGHAFYQHEVKGLKTVIMPSGAQVIDDLAAEMEADSFAEKIGLGGGLKKFLIRYVDEMRETEIKEKALKDLESRIVALSD